jgi:hypothetical protein
LTCFAQVNTEMIKDPFINPERKKTGMEIGINMDKINIIIIGGHIVRRPELCAAHIRRLK